MKSRSILVTLLILFTIINSETLLSDEYIIEIKENSKLSSVKSSKEFIPIFPKTLSKNSKVQATNELDELYKFYRVDLTPEEVAEFRKSTSVLSISPNYKFRIDQPT